MIWASNFLQYFFANFNEDVIVYLRDGMFTDAYDRDEFLYQHEYNAASTTT